MEGHTQTARPYRRWPPLRSFFLGRILGEGHAQQHVLGLLVQFIGVPMQAKMIQFQMPTDAELLAAYGRVTIAHAQLDHMLQMTVKTVANIEVKEALLGTRSMGSTELRQRVRKLAHQRLGEGKSMVLMDAILQEANNATRDRNSFIHDPLAKDEMGSGSQLEAMLIQRMRQPLHN